MAQKFSDYIVGVVIITGLISIFMLFLADGADKYGVPYDNSTFSSYQNKTIQLYNISAQAKERASNVSSQNSIFDILGSLTSQGIVAIKTTFVSVDLFSEMATESVGDLPLGNAGQIFQNIIITIILIIIFIGIFVAIIVKWPT